MANSVNKVILIGNLGKDPDVRSFENNKRVRLNLATSERFKDKSGNVVTHTEWHNVVLWNMPAEIASKYLRKGDQVYIEGKIKTRQWEDTENVKHFEKEIHGDHITLLGNTRRHDGEHSTNGDAHEAAEPTGF